MADRDAEPFAAPPRLPERLTAIGTADGGDDGPGRWERAILDGLTIDAEVVELDECRLSSTSLAGSMHVEAMDCELTRCDLSNLEATRRSRLARVHVTASRLTGLQWPGELSHVHFAGCQLGLSSFRFARLEHVVFEDCVLVEADFHGTRLHRCAFTGCDLSSCSFAEATATASTIRRCELHDLRGVAHLRGVAVDEPALAALAPALADALGIRVAPPEDGGPSDRSGRRS